MSPDLAMQLSTIIHDAQDEHGLKTRHDIGLVLVSWLADHWPMVVDLSAIAKRLNVPKDTVNKWRHRGLLPEPDYPLSVGPVWEWQTIAAWAKETGRL